LLEAYVLKNSKWQLIAKHDGSATVSLPPFESISFNLGDLWLPDSYTVHKDTPNMLNADSG